MKVSIIIPCYNHGLFLLEALESLYLCNPELYEVLIVNDGSTDRETLTILEQLARQGINIFHQPNQGLAAARNQGISLSQTSYILPLDCDNKIRPNYLSQGIQVLDQHPEVGIVYGDVSYFGEKSLVWQLPDFDLPHLLVRNYIDACALFRKEVWESCGGYDEQMPDKLGYEDWDFWLTAVEKGWQFYHLAEVTYDYRVRPDSMVQACKIPSNQRKLVHYLCTKHQSLYSHYLPDVVSEKEFLLFCQIEQLNQEITHLETTIEWMQTSKFWQLRKMVLKTQQWLRRFGER